MSSLDSYQLLTLIFGVVVVAKVVADYNFSYDKYTGKTANLYSIVTVGLPFLFAGYATLIAGATGESASTYKMLVIVLSIGSILLFIGAGSGAATGADAALQDEAGNTSAFFQTPWQSVAAKTAFPLAQGALLALPMVYFGMV
jgi:hypothetical protein